MDSIIHQVAHSVAETIHQEVARLVVEAIHQEVARLVVIAHREVHLAEEAIRREAAHSVDADNSKILYSTFFIGMISFIGLLKNTL